MKYEKWILYAFVLLFVIVNVVFISQSQIYFSFVAFSLFGVIIALLSLKWLFRIAVFFTPISIPLQELYPSFGYDIALPTEPVFALFTVLFFIKLFFQFDFNRSILKHPISILILLQLFWLFITTLTSTMPWVSLKSIITRVWFLIPFYFYAVHLFSNPI